jgi:uncharacterized membrane protein
MENQKKTLIGRIIGFFFRGVAVLLPVGLTVFLIYSAIDWVDHIFGQFFPGFSFPGLGVVIVLAAITLTGVIFSGIIGRFLFRLLDEVMTRTPLVKIIYSSLKDLINAFVGEKKKFNEPVLVTTTSVGTQILGFITRHDLEHFGLSDKVAVYCPYSYSLSGYVVIVNKSHVTPLDANATETMKFIVSGGVAGFSE